MTGDLVQLDGSASAAGLCAPVSYFWEMLSKPTGSTAQLSDPNIATPTFTADLASPPAYVLRLTVDYGTGIISQNEVQVTANTQAIDVSTIKIKPETLNLLSSGVPISAHITLPQGYLPADVDYGMVRITLTNNPDCTLCNVAHILGSESVSDTDFKVQFPRDAVQKMIAVPGDVSLTVYGSFLNGGRFEGAYTIRATKTSSQ